MGTDRLCLYCNGPSGTKWYCRNGCKKRAMVLRTRIILIVRDAGICQLCNKPVDFTLRGSDPAGPTVDHKHPKRVRERDPDTVGINEVQLAHGRCNALRGDIPLKVWSQIRELFYERSVMA